jgi:hypothetical protein
MGVLVFAHPGISQAAQIGTRTLKLSSAEPSMTNVQYELSFDRPSSGVLGSIQLEICTNNPFPGTACTVPVGLSFTAATVDSQTGVAGLSVDASTTANNLILTRAASAVPAGTLVITIGNVQNPANQGTYYARIQTFATTDASGAADDQGGLAITINRRFGLTTEVPPFLTLCVATEFVGLDCSSGTNSFVDFGEFSWTAHTKATSQIILATNAQYGVNLFVTGNTLISGNNTIPAMLVNTAPQTNVSQFGINLRANPAYSFGTDPVGPGIVVPDGNYNIPGSFRYNAGELIASSSNATDYSKLTISYLVDVNKNQSPGVYNSTIIYIATASF